MSLRPAPVRFRGKRRQESFLRPAGPSFRGMGSAPFEEEDQRARLFEGRALLIPLTVLLVGMWVAAGAPGNIGSSSAGALLMLLPMGMLYGAHFFLKRRRPLSDQMLLPIAGMLIAIGLLVIWRLDPTKATLHQDAIAWKQVWWATVGIVVLIGFASLRNLDFLRRHPYTFAFLGVALVAATAIFARPLGPDGAKISLPLFFFSLQPSEPLKILLILFAAGYLESRRDLLNMPFKLKLGPLPITVSLPPVPILGPLLIILMIALVLFVVQRDMGSVLLFYGGFVMLLYVASGRASYVIGGLGIFLVALLLIKLIMPGWVATTETRAKIMLDPWTTADAGGNHAGYQLVQATYSLGAGGLLGTGIGYGRPQYVPEVHTDLVIIAIGEEFGLFGAVLMLGLFALLIYKGLRIALDAQGGYEQLLAASLAIMLGLQILTILGGSIRLLPLTGITVPFISYGGSSLITNCAIIGLLLAISAVGAEQKARSDDAVP